MDTIHSCMKFIIPLALLYISVKSEDNTVTQITGILGSIVFILSFLVMAWPIKVVLMLIVAGAWILFGDGIILFFHRMFSK